MVLCFRRSSHGKRQKFPSSQTHCFDAPPRRTPANIRIYLIAQTSLLYNTSICCGFVVQKNPQQIEVMEFALYIFPETKNHLPRFLLVTVGLWIYLHSNFCTWFQKTHLFCNRVMRVRIARSRSYKVVDFGTNRKHVCNILLVCHSNLGPVLYSF